MNLSCNSEITFKTIFNYLYIKQYKFIYSINKIYFSFNI